MPNTQLDVSQLVAELPGTLQAGFRAMLTDMTGQVNAHASQLDTLSSAGGLLMPFLDLRLAPYNVVANDTTKAAANQTAIKTALAAVTVPWTVVKFPPGRVYVDKDSGAGIAHAFSVRLDGSVHATPMIWDMRGTTLCQYGAGNSGQWVLAEVYNGFQAGLYVLGGAFQCSRIDNPDPSSFQHYLFHFYGPSSASSWTGNVSLIGCKFGQTKRAAIRFLGEAGKEVKNVRILDFDIDMAVSWDGTSVTSVGGGIEFQRGFQNIEIGFGTLKNPHLTAFDMEPTVATGTLCDNLYVHDMYIDGTGSTAVQTVSISGDSASAPITNFRMERVLIKAGNIALQNTTNARLSKVRVLLDQTPAADVALGVGAFGTSPLFYIYKSNIDTVLDQCDGIRTSAAGVPAGPLIYALAQTTLNPVRMTINGGYWEQSTAANLWDFESIVGLTVTGDPHMRYLEGTPGSRFLMTIKGVTYAPDKISIGRLVVDSPNGKLNTGTYCSFTGSAASTSPGLQWGSFQAVHQNSPDLFINGIVFDVSSAQDAAGTRAPVYPVLQGNNFGSTATNNWVATNAAAGKVFPVIAGNPYDVCTMTGTVTPGGTVSAFPGSVYIYRNGASTTRYMNTGASYGTTWTSF